MDILALLRALLHMEHNWNVPTLKDVNNVRFGRQEKSSLAIPSPHARY
jgi:hypothetical protein